MAMDKLRHLVEPAHIDPEELYELVDLIATGSYGKVYTAKNNETGTTAAMKIISPEDDESVEEFVLEVSILKQLNHKNVTRHYGSYIKGDELFIVMELCNGGTVGDFPAVLNHGLKEAEVAQIVKGSLEGLAHMHEQKLIHRDIKGANILLDGKGEVKVADFGVSYQMHHGRRAKTFIGTPYWMAPEIIDTKSGGPPYDYKVDVWAIGITCTFIGTPYWMAPEIIDTKSGGPPYDYKVDVWAIGITCIELAEMNPPLYEMNPMRALFEIPSRPPPRLIDNGEWTPQFIEFVNLCCRKDPAKRPGAAEMLKHPFVAVPDNLPLLADLSRRFKRACDSEDQLEMGDDMQEDAPEATPADLMDDDDDGDGDGDG
eukprot:CAMPEP_0198370858 /NCGR_PEP_ID=MMETSP1450-20131203/156933_1 /TAXON_ID=753684 ORGANISM="Madagascaria erythrocladiodes, Strain CCMP3234" /NCGR_SAMPLE_ID=MMETSP1450 /ASSEMBLY_ACC=CAM_ASM_001115 /LENGTH=370 /DNA_ID=CAMNT_0044078407 /DNA_START=26 /DNA_END=1134 /DNA_ORIENTATION=+